MSSQQAIDLEEFVLFSVWSWQGNSQLTRWRRLSRLKFYDS